MNHSMHRLEILNKALFQLEGDCNLLFIGDQSTRSKDMKHFVLLHNSNYRKLRDLQDFKKLVLKSYPTTCKISLITIERSDIKTPNMVSRKALQLKFK